MTNYYVYYRVGAARRAALAREIARLLEVVEGECAVRGRWMRRRDDPDTYMEVYEGVVDEAAFEAALARAAAGLGLDRHVERFVCA